MSSFTSPLLVEVTQGERQGRGLAKLLQGFSYEVGSLGSGDVITVPAGFQTDFTSVPIYARWFVSNFDKTAKAAVLHDWLLESQSRPRHEADALFREALMVLDVPAWKANALYVAVRTNAVYKKMIDPGRQIW